MEVTEEDEAFKTSWSPLCDSAYSKDISSGSLDHAIFLLDFHTWRNGGSLVDMNRSLVEKEEKVRELVV